MHHAPEHAPFILSTWKLIAVTFAVAAAAGLGAGFLYRASAAVVLAFVTAATGFFLSSQQGFTFWQSMLYAVGLITALQIGYLIGVSISVTLARAPQKASVRSMITSLFKQMTAR